MRSWQPYATLRTQLAQGQVLSYIDMARVAQRNKGGKQQLQQQASVIKDTSNSYRQGEQGIT